MLIIQQMCVLVVLLLAIRASIVRSVRAVCCTINYQWFWIIQRLSALVRRYVFRYVEIKSFMIYHAIWQRVTVMMVAQILAQLRTCLFAIFMIKA